MHYSLEVPIYLKGFQSDSCHIRCIIHNTAYALSNHVRLSSTHIHGINKQLTVNRNFEKG